jgi:excisionase family DNA binding protein
MRPEVKEQIKTPLIEQTQIGELYTPAEVAQYLKVTTATVYSWVKLKMIECYVLTKGSRKTTIRFDAEQINNFILARYRRI